MTEQEFAPREIRIEKAEFSVLPPVKIIVQDNILNSTSSSSALHLRIPEAADLYQKLGDYLRGLEEI